MPTLLPEQWRHADVSIQYVSKSFVKNVMDNRWLFKSDEKCAYNKDLTRLLLDNLAAILADDISKLWIFLNENDRIPTRISPKFVLRSPIHNKLALLQVMAWCRIGDKPLPEPMITQFTDAYIHNKLPLLQVMAWCRIGDKPLP